MLDILPNLLNGFATALQPHYMLYALVGAVLGTITGVLPGLGPLGAMSILLGFTLKLDATGALILFAGIYYAVGSFIAGTISIVGLMLASPFLANVALKFGPAEFFAIGVFGLMLLVRLTGGSALQSVMMILLGMALGTVGMDLETGARRFTLGIIDLDQGSTSCRRPWGSSGSPKCWPACRSRTPVRRFPRSGCASFCRHGTNGGGRSRRFFAAPSSGS